MAKVVVFGTGQWAEMAHFYLTHDSTHEIVAFTVDGDYMKANENRGLPVVPFEEVEKLYPPEQYEMLVSLGFKRVNRLRAEKYHQAKLKGYKLISYISSKAITWPGLACGENCQIAEGVIIQPFAEIGDDVVRNDGRPAWFALVPNRQWADPAVSVVPELRPATTAARRAS